MGCRSKLVRRQTFSGVVDLCECERAFSAAKRLITDDRYNLKSDIIEVDQCLKSWFKYGIADGQAAFNTIAIDEEIVEITSL